MLRFVLFIISVSCILVHEVGAGNPKSRLLVKNYSEGILVYSPSTKMDKFGKSTAEKSLEYDITALSNNDSISLTSTVYSDRALILDSLEMNINGETKRYAIEHIYVEPKPKYWENRFRIYLYQADLQRLTELTQPPIITVGDASFRHSNKKWEKEKDNLKNILEVLKLNKTK